jgi:hypothetical protein
MLRMGACLTARIRNGNSVHAITSIQPMLVVLILLMSSPILACNLEIDRSDPAYTVFRCLPLAQHADAADPAQVARGVTRVDVADLRNVLAEVHGQRVLRADLPALEVMEQLAALLESQPGVPVGLTWNGGIAITWTDYRYAQRSYAEYQPRP